MYHRLSNPFKMFGLALLAVLPVACGCQNKQPMPVPNGQLASKAEDEPKNEAWLQVSESASEISQARKAFADAEREQLDRAFVFLSDNGFVESEHLERCERNRASALEKLKTRLTKDDVTDESIGSAMYLCRMHDDAGRAWAVKVFREGTVEQRSRLLSSLDFGLHREEVKQKYREFLFAESRLVESLLAQLHDPDERVNSAAIRCCGMLAVPGANEEFLKLLRQSNSPEQGRIVHWLAKGELTEELFDFAVQAAPKIGLADDSGTSAFEAFAKSESPVMRERAKHELRKILAASPDRGELGFNESRLSALNALAAAADEKDVDWLLKLAESEFGLYAADPLAAYIRLRPAEGRKLLLTWLQLQERRDAALMAASTSLAGTEDREIISALEALTGMAEKQDLVAIWSVLDAIGGPAAREAIERHAAELDPPLMAYFHRSWNQPSLADIAQVLQSSGLLSPQLVESALTKLSKEKGEPLGLFEFFAVSNSALAFDASTGLTPGGHDRLIRRFAEASRGLFSPEALQEVLRDNAALESPFTVQFISNDRLFRGEIRNFGNWYDVERIVAMINTALARQSIKERFIGLAADGQLALFLFADPQLLPPVAKQFHIELTDDVGSAMRHGREIDEEANKRLLERE